MRSLLYIGLLGSLAFANGCRQDDGPGGGTTPDLSVAPDMATTVSKSTTIRDINMTGGPIAMGDKVQFSGVVISPFMWKSYDDNPTGDDYCHYRIIVMQADGSPSTLGDGMVVTVALKTNFVGDMAKLAACDDLGKKNAVVMAMDGVKMGNKAGIEGTLSTFAGTREINAFAGKVMDLGASPMQPVPVVVADPNMFVAGQTGKPLPQAFTDASGVLVEFRGVQVTTRSAMYQDITVNITNMGGPTIATNYLRVLDKNYMSPTVGTALASVSGIVLGDFKGGIWARAATDIK